MDSDSHIKQEMQKILQEFQHLTEQLARIEQLEQRIAADGGETVVPL